MKKIIPKILILLLLISCQNKSQTKQDSNMITIEKIEEMYSNMHNSGVDTEIKMLYKIIEDKEWNLYAKINKKLNKK